MTPYKKKKKAILGPVVLRVRLWTLGKASLCRLMLTSLGRFHVELSWELPVTLELILASPPPVRSDVPYRYSRTTEDAWPAANAYAFLAHEQKNLACIFTVRAVMPCLGLPSSHCRQVARPL